LNLYVSVVEKRVCPNKYGEPKMTKIKRKKQKEKSLTRLPCLVILGCQTRHADEFVVGDLIPISSSDSSEISESCRP
jgi:predicted transcriptional regulator